MTTNYSVTGKYRFITLEDKKHKFDKTASHNLKYLYDCAALSFHKALIGISELRAIEAVCNEKEAGGLRISRSITTYYCTYHIFVSLMLMDDKENVFIRKELKDGKVPLEVSSILLNSKSQTPEHWDNGKEYEADLGSTITHGDIKRYCEKMRRNKAKDSCIAFEEPYELLYKNFAEHDYLKPGSIKCLYEKLCYVRDRAVYRPTCVIDDITEGYIQTSLDVRKEIEQLPGYKELLSILMEIYQSMVRLALELDEDKSKRNKYKDFLISLWHSPIRENKEYLVSLGWEESDIERLQYLNADYLSFSSYMSQLVELADKEWFLLYINDIWKPFKECYDEAFEAKRR